MEIKNIITNYKYIFLIYIMFTVGTIGHQLDPTKEIMLMLTPITLLVLGSLVLYLTNQNQKSNFILWITITYLFTFLVEVIGVKTGLVFGEYVYGNTLGFKLLDVPLIIGLNWAVVILGSIAVVKLYFKNIFLSSLLVGSICVLFDFIMEPIAIKLDYWIWSNNTIPLQNYFAWFMLTFMVSILFNLLKVKIISSISIHYLIAQIAFFTTLNLLG